MEQFVRTYVYKRKNFDNSEFYATHYVIFNLANLRLHMIDVIADFNMIKVNPEVLITLSLFFYFVQFNIGNFGSFFVVGKKFLNDFWDFDTGNPNLIINEFNPT